ALVDDQGEIVQEYVGDDGEYPRQFPDISFGLTTSELDAAVGDYYMSSPSPGSANQPGQVGYVGDTSFSVDRGFYSFEDLFGVLQNGVTISVPAAAPDSTQILYTVDGSVPELGAVGTQVYSGPISIGTTTTLRAKAIAHGYVPSNVDTHTYLFTDDVLFQDGAGLPPMSGTDYEVDPNVVNDPRYSSLAEDLKSLPTVSFVLPVEDIFGPGGILENATQTGYDWEREASVEMFFPDGSPGFQVNAGLRIQGAGSRARTFSKKGFQLFFLREYGTKQLEFPFFGADGSEVFDRIAFRGNFFDSYTVNTAGAIGTACCGYNQAMLLRDQFGHQTHADMGALAIDGNWVHLYINGQYWGVYNPIERPDATFAATYLGGNPEDYDVLKQRPRGQADGSPPEVVQGDLTAWNELMSLINQDISADDVYQQVANVLDVSAFADYIILNVWGGNFDWPHNNWYAMHERADDARWTFVSWDAENFIFDVNADRSDVSTNNSPGIIYSRLRLNENFRLLFADRVQEHFFHDGALTPEANIARFESIVADIHSAMNAESARWGDTHVEPPRNTIDHFDPLIQNKIDVYFPRRNEIVLNQLRADGLYPQVTAPEFDVNGVDQHGGEVNVGDAVGMSAPMEFIYEDTVLLTQGSPVTVFVPIDDSLESGAIRWFDPAFTPSGWIGGTNGVGYEDIAADYDALIQTDITNAWNAAETSVYTRFPFSLDSSFTAAAYESAVLRMKYDDGFVAYLNGTEIARVNAPVATTWQSNSLSSHPDNLAVNFVDFDVSNFLGLLTPGDNVLAIHGLNQTDNSSDLLILPEFVLQSQQDVSVAPVYFTTDGTDPRGADGQPSGTAYTTPIEIIETTQFMARAYFDGQWSALSAAIFSPGNNQGTVVMTEINYNPAAPTPAELGQVPGVDNDEFEFIEISNTHPTRTINVVDWTLEGGVAFTFPNATLGPGERALIVENLAAFVARYGDDGTILGEWTGGLSNSGEEIQLWTSDRELLQAVDYRDDGLWPERADGLGATLELIMPATSALLNKHYQWRGSTAFGGTPGLPNSTPTSIVINEVRTRDDASVGRGDAIELFNSGETAVDLSGWYLSDSSTDLLKFAIPAGTVLPPGGYAVFNESHFNPNPSSPGPKDFALSGTNGDDVWLVRRDDVGGVAEFIDEAHFGPSINLGTLGRVPNATGALVPMARSTIGCRNDFAAVGAVVITELNFGLTDQEFVEVTNVSGAVIDLTGWRLGGGLDYRFDDGLALPAGESLVVLSYNPDAVSNAGRLASFYSMFDASPGTVQLVGGFQGGLNNSTDQVIILRPDVSSPGAPEVVPLIVVDQVLYDDQVPWPIDAALATRSLQRRAPMYYGNASSSWSSSVPTPGEYSPGTSVPGDLTGDDLADAADLDYLAAVIQQGTSMIDFDLDASGTVGHGDRQFLLESILGALPGDANLDGQVDALDFGSWQAHAFRGCTGWVSGDFNGDGLTDGQDFNIWNAWSFAASNAGSSSSLRMPRAPLYAVRPARVTARTEPASPRATAIGNRSQASEVVASALNSLMGLVPRSDRRATQPLDATRLRRRGEPNSIAAVALRDFVLARISLRGVDAALPRQS
ncbi:MAG: lamin tail domain-containing protein, partial [Planctomycetales bacterium]|nr:lamin tail domain-containing protein [Planctomycetales bacterium]